MNHSIDRRTVLRSGAAAGAMLALPATAFAATPAHDPKLATLFDTLFLEGVRQRPESATLLGLDTGRNADLRSKLSDASDAGRAAARALTASQIKRLAAIDRKKLSAADRLNYDVVLYARRASAAADRFDYAGGPYVISQQNGAYQSTPDFLDTKHPLGNAGDADAWLSRLAAFTGQLDANTRRFIRDAAANVLPADFLLDLTLTQLGKLNLPAKDARLIQSFAARARSKGLSDSYATKAAALYDAQVLPALVRQFEAVKAARAHA
ncbi:MAG: Tat pathway signal protein, partial [Sphingomonas bacterium]|nr:Tat pathway signal protein [Sphingomonas bacterium]